MSFSEIILRVGCSLVAWLFAVGHGLLLLTIPRMPCGDGEGDPFLTLGILAGITLGFSALLPVAMKVPGVASSLRWLFVPLLLLAPFAAFQVVPYLMSSTFGAAPLCEAAAFASGWESFWAPLQLAVLLSSFAVAGRAAFSRAPSS